MMSNVKKILFENISIKQTLMKNTIWLSLAEFIDKGLLAFLAILIARHLGVEEYGQLSFALTFTSFFAVSLDLGLSTLFVREVSRKKELLKNYTSNILGIKFILAILNVFILLIIINVFQEHFLVDVKSLIYFFIIYTILVNFNIFFKSLFQAIEKMQYEAYVRIIQSFALFALGVIFILFNYSIAWIAVAYVLSGFIGFLINIVIIIRRKISFLKPRFNIKLYKDLLKESWPFALSIIFNIIYFKIDIIMLGFLKTNIDVGLYVAAYNIVILFYYLPQTVSSALLPIISRLFLTNREKLISVYKQLFDYHYIFGVFFSLLLFIESKEIINLLFGSDYASAHIVLKILSIAIIFKYIAYISGITLTSINKQKTRTKYQGITTVINIGLNIVLIPYIGIIGAAISTVVTEMFLAGFYFYTTSKNFYFYKNIKLILIPPGIFAIFLVLPLDQFNQLSLIPFITVVYFYALYKTRLLKFTWLEAINIKN